jgi:hypothetical protein
MVLGGPGKSYLSTILSFCVVLVNITEILLPSATGTTGTTGKRRSSTLYRYTSMRYKIEVGWSVERWEGVSKTVYSILH